MSKINKLGKSTFVIAILSFILVAVLAFGGTYAWFSDTAKTPASSTINLGTLIIDDEVVLADGAELVESGKFAVPNQKIIDGKVSTNVNSNINYYVRAIVTVTFTLADNTPADAENGHVCDTNCSEDDKNLNNPIIYSVLDAAGKTIIGSADKTPDSEAWLTVAGAEGTTYLYLKEVQEAGTSFELDIDAKVNSAVGTLESQHYMGATFTISVNFQVCQADFTTSDDPETGVGADLTDVNSIKNSAWATIAPGAGIPA